MENEICREKYSLNSVNVNKRAKIPTKTSRVESKIDHSLKGKSKFWLGVEIQKTNEFLKNAHKILPKNRKIEAGARKLLEALLGSKICSQSCLTSAYGECWKPKTSDFMFFQNLACTLTTSFETRTALIRENCHPDFRLKIRQKIKRVQNFRENIFWPL